MSHAFPRTLTLAVLAAALGVSLSACSLYPFGNSTSAFNMRVGQCVQLPDDSQVSRLETSECTEAHDGEVFHIAKLTDATLPSEDEMKEKAKDNCTGAFEPYVGKSYEESDLEVTWLYPTTQTWATGDREIICIATSMNEDRLMDSVKDSGM